MKRQTNILLIDDDLRVRQALGQALALENYRVVPAQSQREALYEFENQPTDRPIDVVLLDLNPPNEDAWETVQRLTALQPGLPVVAMTTRLEQHDSASDNRGLNALMEKPLDVSALMRTLDQLTSRFMRFRGLCPNSNSQSHFVD